MVHLWSLDSGKKSEELTAEEIEELQKRGYGSILNLVQQLTRAQVSKCELALVTRGAQAVLRDKARSFMLSSRPYGDSGQVIARENPELKCLRIDLDKEEGLKY